MKVAKNQNENENLIFSFCRKNIRYISAAVIVVILAIVLAVSAKKSDVQKEEQSQLPQEEIAAEKQPMEAFSVDAVAEINTLVQTYYEAYAAGDIDTLRTVANPVSELESNYISLMSKYVTGYENIQCHTKPGMNADEYAVSVVMDMRFAHIENTAPGLDFFYVKKNPDGVYYIDNLYSQFNLQNKELEMDSSIEAFISEYEEQKDFVALRDDVQNRYDAALEADEELKNMIDTTIPQAIRDWVDTLVVSAEESLGTDQSQGEESEEPAISETVYVTENANLRKEPNESAEKIDTAIGGHALTRTAIRDDGWSEVYYNGGKAYIKSEFLTTEQPADSQPETEGDTTVNYVPDGITIIAKQSYNVRNNMDENAELMGTTEAGDSIKVIQSLQEGWTKVEWNGKTGYIRTDLLVNN